MTHFTQTHPAQNPVNIELLNFVNQRGQASWRDLFASFGDGDASSRADCKRFCKKLVNLTYTKRLQATGRGMYRMFSIHPAAAAATPARGCTTALANQVDGSDAPHPYAHLQCPGGLVPARVYVSTEPYCPPAAAALRPGALDYRRYASRGHQC